MGDFAVIANDTNGIELTEIFKGTFLGPGIEKFSVNEKISPGSLIHTHLAPTLAR